MPLYFKHSKFQSFVRQLNFYGFHKLRTDPDLNSVDANKTVHFGHEYFKKGQPDLLYRIQRSTRGCTTHSSGNGDGASSASGAGAATVEQVESLKAEVSQLNKQLEQLSTIVDFKLATLSTTIEADYQRRMEKIEHSYKLLSELAAAAATSGHGRRSGTSTSIAAAATVAAAFDHHVKQQRHPSFTSYGSTGSPRATLIPEPTSGVGAEFNASSLLALSGLASLVSSKGSQTSLSTTTTGARPLSPA